MLEQETKLKQQKRKQDLIKRKQEKEIELKRIKDE
jgi:hypothetical protein